MPLHIKADKCILCYKKNKAYEYRNDVTCIDCGLELAEHLVSRETNLKGELSRRGKKLHKRILHLKELTGNNKVTRSATLERENVTCKSCGKQFVAIKINHLKFCGDCTKFKNMMSDLAYKRKYE